jgi:hypothetical protein
MNTKTTTTKRVSEHKKIRMNCDKIGLKLKFNDDQKPKHEMCKRKVETKSYFNNI